MDKDMQLVNKKYCKDCQFFEYSKRGDYRCGTRPKIIVDYVRNTKRVIKVQCKKRNVHGACPYWRKKT